MKVAISERTSGEFLPGAVIDERYEILAKIGEGGFATVYEARHVHMGRHVALKVLEIGTKIPSQGTEFEARFLREAQTASNVEHRCVVTMHDFGFIKGDVFGRPYLVMELLKGHDFARELALRGALDPSRALNLFVPCLEALGEAHRAGTVHKDLKPSNLFLRDPGRSEEALVIVDFGIATVLNVDVDDRPTQSFQLVGTPQYLAPEYIESRIATPALDVYQMGLILIEALTGERVVASNSALKALLFHCSDDLGIPDVLARSPLGPVLERALDHNHETRFPDAAAFAAALAKVDPAAVPRSVWRLPARTEEPTEALTGSVGQEAAGTPPVAPKGDTVADSLVFRRFEGLGQALNPESNGVHSGRFEETERTEFAIAAGLPRRRPILLFVGVALAMLAAVLLFWSWPDPAATDRAAPARLHSSSTPTVSSAEAAPAAPGEVRVIAPPPVTVAPPLQDVGPMPAEVGVKNVESPKREESAVSHPRRTAPPRSVSRRKRPPVAKAKAEPPKAPAVVKAKAEPPKAPAVTQPAEPSKPADVVLIAP